MEAINTYSVHQMLWPLVLGLGAGWIVLLIGVMRWGLRFGLIALAGGLAIPASQFLVRPGLWRALLDPEIAAWNAAYWIIPSIGVIGLAQLLRRRRGLSSVR
jgi:hypothetical protein